MQFGTLGLSTHCTVWITTCDIQFHHSFVFAQDVAFGIGKLHQITLEADSSSQSDTNPQSNWQLWKYTTAILHPIYTNMDHVSLSLPYTSCLSVHSCIFPQLCTTNAMYHKCILNVMRNLWCEMKNLGQVWKSFICRREASSAWCNALQFRKFPPRAFLVAFEASHATCVTHEAYRSNWAKPPLLIKIPPAPL